MKPVSEGARQRSKIQRSCGKVSLERALSKLGLASRSQTREYILSGRLRVDGEVILDPMYAVAPERAKFVLDGKPLERIAWQTILFYKPKGVVTARVDASGERTIFDLLPKEFQGLHAVGRLDKATTGLLLLTNDTKLSSFLTDPANSIPRTYLVTVEGKVDDRDAERACQGVVDKDELLKASKIVIRKASGKESHLIVELNEGKNREIKRLFETLGHPVRKIKRVAFGGLQLGDLKPGEFRFVTRKEFDWIDPGVLRVFFA